MVWRVFCYAAKPQENNEGAAVFHSVKGGKVGQQRLLGPEFSLWDQAGWLEKGCPLYRGTGGRNDSGGTLAARIAA